MLTIRDNGLMTFVDPGADRPILEVKTLQCVHCGGHFPCQPGSGKIRGFCMNCNGPVCGPGCAECVPVEQLLENYEQNRPENFRPTMGAVPALWTP